MKLRDIIIPKYIFSIVILLLLFFNLFFLFKFLPILNIFKNNNYTIENTNWELKKEFQNGSFKKTFEFRKGVVFVRWNNGHLYNYDYQFLGDKVVIKDALIKGSIGEEKKSYDQIFELVNNELVSSKMFDNDVVVVYIKIKQSEN